MLFITNLTDKIYLSGGEQNLTAQAKYYFATTLK
jgi:hypothetical protein